MLPYLRFGVNRVKSALGWQRQELKRDGEGQLLRRGAIRGGVDSEAGQLVVEDRTADVHGVCAL